MYRKIEGGGGRFRSTIFTALGESLYNPHKSCRKGLRNYIKRGHNGTQSRCRNGDAIENLKPARADDTEAK